MLCMSMRSRPCILPCFIKLGYSRRCSVPSIRGTHALGTFEVRRARGGWDACKTYSTWKNDQQSLALAHGLFPPKSRQRKQFKSEALVATRRFKETQPLLTVHRSEHIRARIWHVRIFDHQQLLSLTGSYPLGSRKNAVRV